MQSRWRRYRGLIILAALAGGFFVLYLLFAGTETDSSFETVRVSRGDLTHMVSVTGRVEPVTRTELAFDTTGRLERTLVAKGDVVAPGETLMVLDSAVWRARLEAAQAELSRAEAVKAELLAGTQTETVAIAEANLKKRAIELTRAEAELWTSLRRANVLLKDAINNQVDQFFEGSGSGIRFGTEITQGTTLYTISASNSETSALNQGRRAVANNLEAWDTILAAPEEQDVVVAAQTIEGYLLEAQTFLNTLGTIINGLQPRNTSQQTVYDNFKTDVSAARSTVSTLTVEVQAAIDGQQIAAAAEVVSQGELNDVSAPARAEAVRIEDANIAKARAALTEITAEIDRTYLISPLMGVVTDVALEVGEVVSPGSVAVTVMSSDQYEISAFIPEADIADVKVGSKAKLTLDAFERSRLFEAEVVRIAPAETILDGVPTYETTLIFADPAADIKSGMTAEIDILTSEEVSVLQVPARSVLAEDGREYVRVVTGPDSYEERDVVAGLRGSSGMIEIVEGLVEGDEIVLFLEE